MHYFVYFLFRLCVGLVEALPLGLVYRLGALLGSVAYLVMWPYRRLAVRNLTIAYDGVRSPAEIRALGRLHFSRLGANLLSSIKAASFDASALHRVAEVEGMDHIQGAFARGKGVVLVISHIGNWELFAQLCQFLPQFRWSTVYQPLGNPYIEAYLQRSRTARGVALFSRKNGFAAPTAFLRAGGAVGVLVDQHAGDGGVWTPFFGRLASTSTLAALLAARTGAVMIPMAVYTAGTARWKVVISPALAASANQVPPDVGALTTAVNNVLEAQINVSPADWFWVHNRWKTPDPRFLLQTYRRGIILPPGSTPSLKPFRILIRSTNWLGDAVMAVPAVNAIARGRPDARVTVLAPAKIADLWRAVPAVAEVIALPPNAGVFAAARLIKCASRSFDAAILLPNSLRSALEVWLAGIPRRAGFLGHRRSALLNQIIPEPPFGLEERAGKRQHQAERYTHIARTIGAEGFPPPMGAFAANRAASSLGAERGGWLKLGLCPGAEYGPTKRWMPERFAEASLLVTAARASNWVLFGTSKDLAAGEIVERALGERCENLIGKTSLTELMSALAACDLLLTNDTGTMHLAAFLGVPVVAVFGSTDPVLTGPLAPPDRVRIVRHQVVCSPCFLRECPLDLRCLKVVSPEEVARTVLDLIGTAPTCQI